MRMVSITEPPMSIEEADELEKQSHIVISTRLIPRMVIGDIQTGDMDNLCLELVSYIFDENRKIADWSRDFQRPSTPTAPEI